VTTDIEVRFKTAFAEAAEQYGSPWAIPHDELHTLSEKMRAEHVVAIYGKADPQVLRSYSIPAVIIEELCGEAPTVETKRSYRQRKQAVEAWCTEHAGTTVTPVVIADIGEFSDATARTFIGERPDLFTKVKRGHYFVRDPKTERQQS
jgi:hypothetical protein